MDLFAWRKLSFYSVAVGFICILAAFVLHSITPLFYTFVGLGVFLICAFFVINLIFWKCPHCHRAFDMRHSKMDRSDNCPYCYKKLR